MNKADTTLLINKELIRIGIPLDNEHAGYFRDGYLFAQKQALTIPVVIPRFLKTKYTLEKLDEHIHELSCRTEHWIHRGKLEDIEKLIRWRRRYDALNGA